MALFDVSTRAEEIEFEFSQETLAHSPNVRAFAFHQFCNTPSFCSRALSSSAYYVEHFPRPVRIATSGFCLTRRRTRNSHSLTWHLTKFIFLIRVGRLRRPRKKTFSARYTRPETCLPIHVFDGCLRVTDGARWHRVDTVTYTSRQVRADDEINKL